MVQKPLLGRFKNSLKMGVVGMPNVGKVSKRLFFLPFFFLLHVISQN